MSIGNEFWKIQSIYAKTATVVYMFSTMVWFPLMCLLSMTIAKDITYIAFWFYLVFAPVMIGSCFCAFKYIFSE